MLGRSTEGFSASLRPRWREVTALFARAARSGTDAHRVATLKRRTTWTFLSSSCKRRRAALVAKGGCRRCAHRKRLEGDFLCERCRAERERCRWDSRGAAMIDQFAAKTVPLLHLRPNWPKLRLRLTGSLMQTLSAKDAKYGFGRLIDLARAEPVAVAKHGRPVVVVLSVEEYERLKSLDAQQPSAREERD